MPPLLDVVQGISYPVFSGNKYKIYPISAKEQTYSQQEDTTYFA